jgi:uncharacterized protein YoxC
MKRHLVTASLVIAAVAFIAVVMFVYTRHQAIELEAKCQSRSLEVFQIGEDKICREPSTGLLYAP